jgi:rhamnosyl/mannosyltransferase
MVKGIRVLTVVTEARPVRSGLAEVATQVISGLRVLGHEVDVITVEDVGRMALGEVRMTGLPRHWRRLRRLIEDYDVVHLHGPAPTFSDAFLTIWRTAPAARRPALVYTHHSEIELRKARPFCWAYNSMHRRLMKAASHVVVSTESYRSLLETHSGRVHVIPFGVEQRSREVHRERGRLTVAFVGQLRPYKGVDTLIRAATFLPDVTFEIAGTGHQEQMLRRLAHELEATNVRFHGAVSDEAREDLLRRAHIIALPSTTRAEAFGLVLLEGMALGAVPVASDLPGVRDIAGATGLLATPGHVQSLVQAICVLRDDPDDLRRRSRASVERAEEYTWSATVREYHRVISDAALLHRLETNQRVELLDTMALLADVALAERSSLLLLDDQAERLDLVASCGLPFQRNGSRHASPWSSFAGRALLTDAPYVVNASAHDAEAPEQPEVYAGLCMPFHSRRGDMHGVFTFSRLRALDFGREEIAWVRDRVETVAARFAPLRTAPPATTVLLGAKVPLSETRVVTPAEHVAQLPA